MEMGLPLAKIVSFSPFILLINLPFVLPLGFITGYILTFSRLSVDREIQIIRAAGISLARIILPHLVFTFFFSIIACYVYQNIIPVARSDFQKKLFSLYRDIPPVTETYNKPSLLLNKGQDRIYVIAKKGEDIKGITIQHIEKGKLRQVTFAEHATITRTSKGILTFHMKDVSRLIIKDEYIDQASFEELTVDMPISEDKSDEAAGGDYALMSGAELKKIYKNKDETPMHRRKAELRYWLRLALAMACFSFTLFGVSSGILSTHKSKTSGFVVSILYSLIIFFPLLMGTRSFLMERHNVPASLMLFPNIIFIIYGCWLLRKVLKI